MPLLRLVLFTVMLAALAPLAQGQILLNTTTVSTIPHSHNAGNGFSEDYLIYTNGGAATAPSFTANLLTANTFQWTITAPAGQQFRAVAPVGTIQDSLQFQSSGSFFYQGGTFGTQQAAGSTTVSFANQTGAFASNTLSLYVYSTGNAVGLSGGLGLSAVPVTFTSMTITANFSNLTSRTGWPTNGTYNPSATFVLEGFSNDPIGTTTDLGPSISLVAVPEPSTLAMLAGMGALTGIGLVRRRVRLS